MVPRGARPKDSVLYYNSLNQRTIAIELLSDGCGRIDEDVLTVLLGPPGGVANDELYGFGLAIG